MTALFTLYFYSRPDVAFGLRGVPAENANLARLTPVAGQPGALTLAPGERTTVRDTRGDLYSLVRDEEQPARRGRHADDCGCGDCLDAMAASAGPRDAGREDFYRGT
jgi:hypothetical protein